jgi:(p)ppGpp synthase/HD superfamily hydrolase
MLAPSRRPETTAPGYDLFFAPLEVELELGDVEKIKFAYVASKYGHGGQQRDGGGRYFDHPKAAAWIYIHELGGRDPRVIVDTLMHDMSEDTRLLSPYRIAVNFGREVALDIRALTKLPKGKETTEQYLRRIIDRGPWAILAKLLDRLHNLRTRYDCLPDKIVAVVQETKDFHLPMLIPALASFNDEWPEYAATMQRLIEESIAYHPPE